MDSEQTTLLPQTQSPTQRDDVQTPRRRPWKRIVAATALTATVCGVLVSRSRLPWVPDRIDHQFGVGFDMTYPYAAAAVSYPNGSIVNVAQIDISSSAYEEMMHRLAQWSSMHPSPPYRTIEQWLQDMARQSERKTRKLMGFPASADVGQIVKVISRLREEVEAHLGGQKISGATITAPHLWALYPEDLRDAFDYTGLLYVPKHPIWGLWADEAFLEPAAVYTASGLGRCADCANPERCRNGGGNSSQLVYGFNVLSVSYTRGMLASTWSRSGADFSLPEADLSIETSFSFGSDSDLRKSDEKSYWAKVRDTIIRPALEEMQYLNTTVCVVIAHGESAEDERFQEVLSRAVDEVFPNKPRIYTLDPTYAAARGAAEMARKVYGEYNRTHSGGTQAAHQYGL